MAPRKSSSPVYRDRSPTKIILQSKPKAAGRAPATIKPPPKKIVSNAMGGLRNPRSQTPAKRQSVDGRIGAEAAVNAEATRSRPKAPERLRAKPARPTR